VKPVFWGVLALLPALFVGFALYVRLAPSSVARWHVDPVKAVKPLTPNAFLWRPGEGAHATPVYQMDALSLARAFEAHVLSYPNVKRLAGSPDSLFVTYVARTPILRYPDYVSLRFLDLEGGGATLAVFSRARFGRGDFGLNRKRFLGWIEDFRP